MYYTAKEVNLVMAPNGDSQTVEILQNGEPLGRPDAGEDVRYAPSGKSIIIVDTPRMYNLVRNHEFGQNLLQLGANQAGLECFAFTFTTCADPWA